MAARGRHTSVGTTTDVASLGDQITQFRKRSFAHRKGAPKLRAPVGKTKNNIPTLAETCIQRIVDDFETTPVYDAVPSQFMRQLSASLPLTITPIIAAQYVFDENYWKRRCLDKYAWHNCRIEEHGLTWKQLFYEKYVQEVLEEWNGEEEPEEELWNKLAVCSEYVFTLTANQLLGHPDMERVCTALPNLCRMQLQYGVNKIGMAYERILFGMKISDAQGIANYLKKAETLTTLELSMNLLDDDLLRMLMVGLIANETVTHLDVSHNRITNHGARLLSKLLGANSILTSLDLSDNLIHSEGGRYLARGLRENHSLLDLNLRLNRLTDEGGKMLTEGCLENSSLTSLNLSANSLGRDTIAGVSLLLRTPDVNLAALDLSANELGMQELKVLKESLTRNATLTSIDLRNNRFDPNDDDAARELLNEINECVHQNELHEEHF
mmetsp:Transcript_39495/g.123564  ORF Transcript_39495/g.123564 Transcript_39495/m.123564 type:complete len:439 (-) Transcript_39495:962-2278(-)|eukprot:CAMPEP_0118870636 /NCGR_PEP_ID=MMETSP1163-20130328/13524_1 /TAXON_ID=124430 /ORGANISM="Phaeomonas parva, Strain CCMP2877" /LENGTH=438 /DNA_ID=CAMNT_0006805657 /DNA_START=136 /DNA_END=1452 /DNA_ORIENTATION=+